MLDFDLATMYGVKTGRLNEQVKRNIERFPEDFMFQLTKGELEILRSQFVILKKTDYQEDDNWKSQNVTSNLSDNQHDSVLISQNATSKPVERRGGTQKRPYAFIRMILTKAPVYNLMLSAQLWQNYKQSIATRPSVSQ